MLSPLGRALKKGHVVLTGPTGSGKTTLIPPALLDETPATENTILLLEPRRVAARAAARRISSMLDCRLGTTVGYRTRFESNISKNTRIEVVTEGILIRRLQHDPGLEGVGLVIFDEFHERSLQADLGLALCLDLCELRDDLRLLVMSATLESEDACKLLGNAPHISASGRSYPVTIHYSPPSSTHRNTSKQMAGLIRKAWNNESGDILAFFPGVSEISQCHSLLATQLPEALLLPLYGNLTPQEQDRVFEPDERRRIILATPIAETSLTIENIGSVVDSGLYRRPVHDPGSGLSRLTTMRISRASADQRSGRAGRTGPGACYRLWSREENNGLLPRTPPEMLNGDLCSLALELALWGVADPSSLRWLDPPRPSAWSATQSLLQSLALLDSKGRITDRGQRVAALPLHPRLGVLLIAGSDRGLPRTSTLLAALLSERDIIKGDTRNCDIEMRLQLLGKDADRKMLTSGLVDRQQLKRIQQQAAKWLASLHCRSEKKIAYGSIGDLLVYGFPDRIGKRRPGSRFRYLLSSGKGVELPEGDLLCGTKLIVAPEVDGRKGDGRIFLAASLDEDDLAENHTDLLEEHEIVSWNRKTERIDAVTTTQLGQVTLNSRPLDIPSSAKMLTALMEGIRSHSIRCLPFTRESRELQSRVCSLHHWHPDAWPDWSDAAMLDDLDWLTPYCDNIRTLTGLKKLNLKTILLSRLDWQKQQELDTLAPTHLRVPSGSNIRLSYSAGEPPVLAVRLQEVFGLLETPTICRGEVPVLLHLLSPARRPLQITTDLNSFWRKSYREVRKELAGRYPKHYWPEDPLGAQATSGTKPKQKT